MSMRLLAVVGTDIHPFPRMVRAVDRWTSTHLGRVTSFVQYGYSAPPTYARGEAFLAHDELEKRLVEADVVVCHGGPSTISEARRIGFRPIVFPRRVEYGEHVDDHQNLFVRRLAEDGLVHRVGTEDEVERALDAGLANPSTMRVEDADRSITEESVHRFGALVDGLFG